MQSPTHVPVSIARLLVAYFCHTITESGKDILDEWICMNDENMKVFEECLDIAALPKVYDAERETAFEAGKIQLN